MSQTKPLTNKNKPATTQERKPPVPSSKVKPYTRNNLPKSGSTKDLGSAQPTKNNDAVPSLTSTDPAKSIYVQRETQDEWATIAKYDAELYKREQHQKKIEEKDQKRKIKEELDKQINERKRLKAAEEMDMKKYSEFIKQQVKQQDVEEKRKEQEFKDKIIQQKLSRDRQLSEEKARRKHNKQIEEQNEAVLVKRIQDEINEGIRNAAVKRQQEKESLKKIFAQNQLQKKQANGEAKKLKESDKKAQEAYSKLIEQQEANRDAEVKSREERTRKFMDMMADTVVKDQKAMVLAEEKRLLKHIQDKEARDAIEEKKRQQREFEQQQDLKKFLLHQVQEKKEKKQEESLVGKKQAEIWKKDAKEFMSHEVQKINETKDANQQNASFLKHQMSDKKKQKKMNQEELLYNKPLLKEIASNEAEAQFEKQIVKPHRLNY